MRRIEHKPGREGFASPANAALGRSEQAEALDLDHDPNEGQAAEQQQVEREGEPPAGRRRGSRLPRISAPSADEQPGAPGEDDDRRDVGVEGAHAPPGQGEQHRTEEHTSELQSLMRISYADLCLKKKKKSNY